MKQITIPVNVPDNFDAIEESRYAQHLITSVAQDYANRRYGSMTESVVPATFPRAKVTLGHLRDILDGHGKDNTLWLVWPLPSLPVSVSNDYVLVVQRDMPWYEVWSVIDRSELVRRFTWESGGGRKKRLRRVKGRTDAELASVLPHLQAKIDALIAGNAETLRRREGRRP